MIADPTISGSLSTGPGVAAAMDDDTAPVPRSVDEVGGPPPGEPPATGTVSAEEAVVIGGSYRVGAPIGRGGMGVVYDAWHLRLDKRVALKLLKTADATPEQLRRFEFEGRALAALDHPGIARVYDAGVHRLGVLSIPYMAMELLAGARSIVQFASDQGLDLAARVRLIIDACGALDHAHAAGIVHRDVKPSNLLVTPDGRLKVIDFGAAAALPPDGAGSMAAATLATDPGSLLGTLAYMSPEHFDTAATDRRADVYSLGMVLYELLCGRRPYDLPGRDLAAAERVVRDAEPPAPRKLNRRIDRSLEAVILSALHKDRSKRYQSAAALAADLRRTLEDRPVSVRRRTAADTAAGRARRFARHHPRWATAALTAVAIVLACVAAVRLDRAGATRWYERDAPVWMNYVPDEPSPHLRLIAMDAGTDFEAIARAAGIPGVSNSVRPSWRAVHGQFLRKLSAARPRVVALDLHFAGASPYDAALADGMAALADAGIPVVLSQGDYDGRPAAGERVAPGVRDRAAGIGAATAQKGVSGPMIVHLAIQRGASTPHPTFALLAAACYWKGAAPTGVLLYIDEVRLRWPDGSQRAVRPTELEEQREPHTNTGILPGDVLAQSVVEMPRPERLRDLHVPYDRAFAADAGELRRLCEGKLVLIGDLREGADGPYYHRGGREFHGPHAVYQAVRQLVEGRELKRLPLLQVLFLGVNGDFAVAAAAVGVGMAVGGFAARRGAGRGALLGLVVIVVLAATSATAYQWGGWLIGPIVPGFLILTVAFGLFAADRLVRVVSRA